VVHDAFPDKKLLCTEAGMGGNWRTAVNLARNMIMDLNNWANGWVFWNPVLDEDRGPRHAGGTGRGSSIVTLDTRTGELTFNPPHYYFGHFSRFIRPGARRVACTSNNDDFLATAFVNPDGKAAVVVLNLATRAQPFQVWVQGKAVQYRAPAQALLTVVL
jgi:glucosylceramidase